MTGMNTPCRIGQAVCLPGDVVFGTQSGVLFIPAHLAEEVVVDVYKRQVHDAVGGDFDAMFGPAYKGIPLATSAAGALARNYGRCV